MADDRHPPSPSRRRHALHVARRVVLAVAGLALGIVLLAALTVGGLLLYARTDSGQRWLTSTVSGILDGSLQSMGLGAHIDGLTGSLPSSLSIKGLTLTDADGPWLTVDKASLGMGWSALRKNQLVARTVRVEHPVLLRLPHLPSTPEPENAAPSDPLALLRKLAEWPKRLPSLAVEHIDVLGLTLSPDVAGELMVLTLHGSASASAKGLRAGLSLRRDDVPGAEQGEVLAAITPDAFLDLRLALAENNHGLIARRVPPDIARQPALRVMFQGGAPLTAWRGDFNMDLLEADPLRFTNGTLEDRTVLAARGVVDAAPLAASPSAGVDLKISTGNAASGLWRLTGQRGGNAVLELAGKAVLSRPPAPTAETSRPGSSAMAVQADGNMALGLSSMQWSDGRLNALLGDDVTLRANLAAIWRGGAPLVPASDAVPGQTPSTQTAPDSGLVLAVRGLDLKAGTVSAGGEAAWTLPGLAPLSPASTLYVDLSAALADTAELGIPGFSTHGPVRAGLTADGPLSALDLALTVRGDELTLSGEAFSDLHARIAATRLDVADFLASPAEGVPSGGPSSGTLDAGARTRGQNMTLAARWELDPATRKAAVRDVDLRAAGVKVEGGLAAILPHASPTDGKTASSPDGASARTDIQLTGELRAELTDWQTLSAVAGVPLRGGKASLTVTLTPDAGGQSLRAAWALDNLTVMTSTPSTASAISQTSSTPSVPSTQLAVSDARGEIRATDIFRNLQLDARNSTGRVAADSILVKTTLVTARGGLSGPLDLTVQATGDVAVEAKATWKPGEIAAQTLNLRLSAALANAPASTTAARPIIRKASAAGRPTSLPASPQTSIPATPTAAPLGLRLVKPAIIRYGDNGFSTPGLDVDLQPSGSIHVQGGLNANTLNLSGRIDNLRLGLFRVVVPALPDATVTARLTVSGTPARPGGSLSVHLDKLRVPGSLMPPVSCAVEGSLEPTAQGGALNARLLFPPADLAALGASEASASLRLPLIFTNGGLPRPAPNRALAGQLRWTGELAPLWNFLPLADRRLTGTGSLHADLAGTMDHPRLTGQLNINGAIYDDLVLGLQLSGITASVQLDKASGTSTATTRGPLADLGLARLTLRAGDGLGGTLALNGTLNPVTLAVDATGSVNNLKPLRRQDLRMSLSGDASVTGSVTDPAIRAAITVNQGELQLTDLPGGSIPTLPISNAAAPVTSSGPTAPMGSLDITITVPNRFFVRGHGLDSEWKGSLHIQGSLDAPSIVGSLNAVRGSIDLLNKNFSLAQGNIVFDGGQPINPLLNIIMSYTAPNIVAEATVGGTASHPKLTLSSQPSMPQDEIIAQVMFGESASKLGRLETLQLAGAAAALAGFGNGGGGVLDMARNTLGVDVLRFNSSNAASNAGGIGGTSLEVGKYVTDKVYVGVNQGIDADSTGVLVEIDLTQHINLEARSDTKRTEVGVQWTYDY